MKAGSWFNLSEWVTVMFLVREDRKSGRSEVGWTAFPTSVSPEFFSAFSAETFVLFENIGFRKDLLGRITREK